MRKFGIIGFPLSHSFSPGYFSKKFVAEGIVDTFYDAYPINSIEKLTHLLAVNPQLKGLNVTIPYKKSVIPFLDSAKSVVLKIGACNCIKIKNGSLQGFNTDVTGFEKSILPKLTGKHTKALILGTGGSASAVEFVLEKLGIEFLFVSRNNSTKKKSLTYNQLTKQVIEEHLLIINTTPLGMFPQVDNCPDIPYQFLTPDHYLFDLIYNPAETLFLRKGLEKGAVIKNGADMLIIQAEESWKIWNEE